MSYVSTPCGVSSPFFPAETVLPNVYGGRHGPWFYNGSLYFATRAGSSGGSAVVGLLRSDDYGVTWTKAWSEAFAGHSAHGMLEGSQLTCAWSTNGAAWRVRVFDLSTSPLTVTTLPSTPVPVTFGKGGGLLRRPSDGSLVIWDDYALQVGSGGSRYQRPGWCSLAPGGTAWSAWQHVHPTNDAVSWMARGMCMRSNGAMDMLIGENNDSTWAKGWLGHVRADGTSTGPLKPYAISGSMASGTAPGTNSVQSVGGRSMFITWATQGGGGVAVQSTPDTSDPSTNWVQAGSGLGSNGFGPSLVSGTVSGTERVYLATCTARSGAVDTDPVTLYLRELNTSTGAWATPTYSYATNLTFGSGGFGPLGGVIYVRNNAIMLGYLVCARSQVTIETDTHYGEVQIGTLGPTHPGVWGLPL